MAKNGPSLEQRPVKIKLHWIQGHLDTLDTVEAKKWFPPLWFALNHAADYFANFAAKSVELPRNITSVVIDHVHLVAHVQKRLTKIIATLPFVPREVVELKSPKPRRAIGQTCCTVQARACKTLAWMAMHAVQIHCSSQCTHRSGLPHF